MVQHGLEIKEVGRAAKAEAARWHHPYVGTEHLLLALSRDAVLMKRFGLNPEEVRARVESALEPGPGIPRGRRPLPTQRAAKAFDLAGVEAAKLAKTYAGGGGVSTVFLVPEHLVLGLLSDGDNAAARTLVAMGLDLERARRVAASDWSGRPEYVLPASRFRVVIDDTSESSIRDQIVEQVRGAIERGEMSAGDRLQPVRRLADVLDIGPGTVARAYDELEQLGLVVTEGPRGAYVSGRASDARAS
jgi:ATP-dependent Clp protease ATP-binding subunit ClpA